MEEAAAHAVCLGSHAARGDYGHCDSASVAGFGSHAARGGCSSLARWAVEVVARLE